MVASLKCFNCIKLYGFIGQPCAHMHKCCMDSLSSMASACTIATKGISLCDNTVY